MEALKKTVITVSATINAPVAKVWEYWTSPAHIIQWNSASPDWHTPKAENDLREGGRFTSRMEARDGSMGFDFGGVYTAVETHKKITYTMDDNRKVIVQFTEDNGETVVTEDFEAESENPEEMQKAGWQSIMDNFKNYAEANA
jgi:uncharacterized protein YndB with AHSA1/START domain